MTRRQRGSPMFLVPQTRRTAWPSGDEIKIPGKGVLRVLVVLEEPHKNFLFTTDMRPWCVERRRSNVKDLVVRDLPMPVGHSRYSHGEMARMPQQRLRLGDSKKVSVSTSYRPRTGSHALLAR